MLNSDSNWAGNYTYQATGIKYPHSVSEIQELVKVASKIKALGTRHSFNAIADCEQELISLRNLNHVVELDAVNRRVTVEGGIQYGELCREIHSAGFALQNLASLPHISVTGACATASHGSGDRNACLASAVSALEFVSAEGEVIQLLRERDPDFGGAVVNLGALGIVTKMTLDIVPSFRVKQKVYEGLTLRTLERYFDEILSSAYSVSLFTDWKESIFNQVWVKTKIDQNSHHANDDSEADDHDIDGELYGAKSANSHVHPIASLSARNCTEQLGIPGPWYQRLPHFKIEHTPSSGDELQSEYFVSRPLALRALQAIEALKEQIAPVLQISEVRSIAGDNHWMSPCYQQASISIHFTWKRDWQAVKEVLPRIEAALSPYLARPHWGKLFTMDPLGLQALYSRLPDFRKLLERYDPTGKFLNAFLEQYLYEPISFSGRAHK